MVGVVCGSAIAVSIVWDSRRYELRRNVLKEWYEEARRKKVP